MIAQADTIAISGLIYVASQFGLTSVLERYTNRRDAVLAASKLVGGLHAMIVGGSALLVITQSKWQNNDLINTSSSDGDRVIATEAGYMIGDTIFLLLRRKQLNDPRLFRRVTAHHIIFSSLLLLYLRAVEQEWAKGTFFVTSFIIMNLSTPLRYVVWAVKKFTNAPESVVSGLHGLAMTVYATARFALIYYQMWVYGQRKSLTPLQAFNSLPPVCRISTVLLLASNLTRFLQITGRRRRKIR